MYVVERPFFLFMEVSCLWNDIVRRRQARRGRQGEAVQRLADRAETADRGGRPWWPTRPRYCAATRRLGDPQLKEELVRRFLPLARSLALRYRGTPEQLEDLIQVASLGLIKALDGFDPEARP